MNSILLDQQMSFLAKTFRNAVIMVSGSTGLIGSGVVRYLKELNDRYNASISIVALYRSTEKRNKVYRDLINRRDFLFSQVSDEDVPSVDFNVDYVIHAAGISGGTKMHLKDPEIIFKVGINGTKNLLEFAIAHGCKGFLFVSTYEIYGVVDSDQLIKEDHPCILDPMVLRNSYAEVKRTCEAMLTAYNAKYGINVYSARITSTFGAGVDYNDPRFFAEFGRCIVERRNIILKSKGDSVRNYLDVNDAASAFLYILAQGITNNAYNITNMNNAYSIKEMANEFINVSGGESELLFDIDDDIQKLGFRKQGKTLLDANKMLAIGWKPVFEIKDTIENLLIYMKKG